MPVALDAFESDPQDAVKAIREHGSFVLQRAVISDQLQRLHDGALEYFQCANREGAEGIAVAAGVQKDNVSGPVDSARKRGVVHHALLSRFLYRDPRGLERAFVQMIASDRLFPFVRAILGDCLIHTNNLAIRFRDGARPELAIPFHQDSFWWEQPDIWSGSSSPVMLVVWLPFVCCDADIPGLELVPLPIEKQYDLRDEARTQFDHLEADVPDDLPVWYPHLAQGDAIVFTERTLHRSHSGLTTQSRTSVDIRMFSMDRIPRVCSGHRGLRLPDLTDIDL